MISAVFGIFSFLIAFLIVSVLRPIWMINTAGRAVLFAIGVFLLANVICYKVSQMLLRSNPDKSIYSTKIMIVGGSVILFLSLFIGIIKIMPFL